MPLLSMTLADGFPVNVRHLVRSADTLIYLDMIGPKASVKATWAKLKDGGRSHHVLHDRLKLNKDEHIRKDITLPCGWMQMVLLNKQASYEAIDLGQAAYFYLIDWNRVSYNRPFHHCAVCGNVPGSWHCLHQNHCNDGRQPANFYPMLAKALPFPILREWADYLWEKGLSETLIFSSRDTSHQSMAFVVSMANAKWKRIIQHGLQNHIITF